MDKHKAVIEKIKATMKEWEEKRRSMGLPVSNEGTRTFWNAHKKHDKFWKKTNNMKQRETRQEGGMKVKEKSNEVNGHDGQYRKARKEHPCDVVKFFGLYPHSECAGEIKPNQYYWDIKDIDNGGPFKSHKLCRFCAEMEYDNAPMMSPEERKEYREARNG